MPCGICKQTGHYSSTCTSPLLEDKAAELAQRIRNRFELHLRLCSNLSPGTLYKSVRRDNALINITHHCSRDAGIDHVRNYVNTKRLQWMRLQTITCTQCKHLTSDWSVALLSRAIPLTINYIDNYLCELSPAYSSILIDYTRLHMNDAPANTKGFYRNIIMFFYNFAIQRITPHSFLDVFNNSIEQLCLPPPPPVISNDDVIRNAVELLLQNRDVSSCIATIKQTRKDELDRAALQAKSAENIAVRRAIERTRRNLPPQRAPAPSLKQRVKFRMDSSTALYTADDTCPVCMETLKPGNTVAMSCSHAFCASCTGEFINKCNGKCPSCREAITEIRFKHDICHESFNSLVSSLSS